MVLISPGKSPSILTSELPLKMLLFLHSIEDQINRSLRRFLPPSPDHQPHLRRFCFCKWELKSTTTKTTLPSRNHQRNWGSTNPPLFFSIFGSSNVAAILCTTSTLPVPELGIDEKTV
ncbi:hypothetical protein LXL04_036747 [Taraxacum kok-saghyz]